MENKEAIYDAEINPLIAQVIEICKQHRIAMVATFAIPSPDDADLLCTTALLSPEYEPPPEFLKALSIIKGDPRITKLTITKADGSKEVEIIADLRR